VNGLIAEQLKQSGPQPGNSPEILKNILKAPISFQFLGTTTSHNNLASLRNFQLVPVAKTVKL